MITSRRLAVCVAAAALVAPQLLPPGSAVARPDHAAANHRAACSFAGARTETRSVYARIFRLPHKSATFGCWYGNGRLVRLTARYREIGGSFHLNGRWVAFNVWRGGVGLDVRVFDLKRGKQTASYMHRGESVEQLELAANAAVAWIAHDPVTGNYLVRAGEDGEERLLDPGPGVFRRGLAVAAPANESVIVYWLRADGPHSARLKPPCDQCL